MCGIGHTFLCRNVFLKMMILFRKDPFHLSRRGWGEFPVRVQIFFHCSLNKPVDIIHNLKLDRTYTGRQTLGIINTVAILC